MLTLSKSILDAYKNDELVDAVIWGPKGYGKSIYVLLILYQVYGSWREALKHLWFNPEPLRKQMIYYLKNGIRTPLEVIDDASMHLSKRSWNEWKIKRFGEAYNAVREICGGMLFTAPNKDDIAKDIREEIQGNIPIHKGQGYERMAVVYHWKTNIVRSYPVREKQDYFNLTHMDKDWYEGVYRPRKQLALLDILQQDDDNGVEIETDTQHIPLRLRNLNVIKKETDNGSRPMYCTNCGHNWLHKGKGHYARCPKCFKNISFIEINEPSVVISDV